MLFQRVISRQREPSAYQGGTLVSIGLHTILLGAVGWHIGAGPVAIHDTIAEGIMFLAPLPAATAGPGTPAERLTFTNFPGPEGIGDVLGSDAGSVALAVERATGPKAGSPDAGQEGSESLELPNIFATRSDSIYLSSQVDNPAAFDSRSGAPMYPDSLRNAGVEGAVTAQFVVDTTGRVELSSFVLLESTHGRFTESVREALPRMLFRPAELNGQKIKQLVQLPFIFKLQPANALASPTDTTTQRVARRP
jgi:protein TonB